MTESVEISGPEWKKLKDFIYEITDPSGGVYRMFADREMTQEELFRKWQYVYIFCGRNRPTEGEVHSLKIL